VTMGTFSFETLIRQRWGRGTGAHLPISRITVAVAPIYGWNQWAAQAAMLTHANLSVACNQIRETAQAARLALREGASAGSQALPLFQFTPLT